MQEHARWSVLMNIISLLWLKESDLKRPFARAMKAVFDQSKLTASTACSTDATMATKVDGKSLIDILTITLAAIVKTNSALSTPEMTIEDRDDKAMLESIRLSRRLFQLMCEAAAQSTDQSTRAARRRGRGTAANSRAASRAASVAPAMAGGISTPAAAAGMANTMATMEIEEDDAVDNVSTSTSIPSPKKPQVSTVERSPECAYRPALYRRVSPVWIGFVVDGLARRDEAQVSGIALEC